MARWFRKVGCESNVPPIFFLQPTRYKLKNPFNENIVFIYAEPYIDKESWKKLTNNYTHCQD